MIDRIKIGKPATYSGQKRITVSYTGITWDKSRELTISKCADETTWSIFEEKRVYVGNGMVCEKSVTCYGRGMQLREAKARAIALMEDYHNRMENQTS